MSPDRGVCISPQPLPIGPGGLVLVVGPSGAGKDTLIAYARERLAAEPRIVFPRRVITREADPALEDHAAVGVEAFQAMLARRSFALHWKAHGLCYGVPAEIDAAIEAGSVAVVNVSREIVTVASRRYAHVLAVSITAPPDMLAERLGRRGRETQADIEGRLARGPLDLPECRLVRIANDGPIEHAGEKLVGILTVELAAAQDRVGAGRRAPA